MYDTSRHNGSQVVPYTDTAAPSTNAFGPQTRQIRIAASSGCHYAIAKTPVATVTDAYLPPNWVEYVTVNPGEKISAVQAATGGLVVGTAGSLWVTELT